MERPGVAFGFLVAMVLAIPGNASADETGTSVDVVGGTVRFESRSTYVPLTICVPGQVCPKPARYWAVVLDGQEQKIEMDHPFAFGSVAAPQEVEYRGVVIRPGSQLKIRGKLQNVSAHYAFISEVREIRFEMDALPPEASASASQPEAGQGEQ